MTGLWSLSEITALAVKAARGAGYEWGLAQDAGQSVHWLLERDLPGAEALVIALRSDALEQPSQCPIRVGCAICDGAMDVAEIAAAPMNAPLLVLPFVAWAAARDRRALVFSWAETSVEISAKGEVGLLQRISCPERGDVSVNFGKDRKFEDPKCHRACVDCETYVALSSFAERTYAPATEAGRLSGAGAGLTDND